MFVWPCPLPLELITHAYQTQHDATPDLAPPAYSSPSDYRHDAEIKSDDEDAKPKPSSSTMGNVAAAASSAANATYEELKAQLEKAQGTIAQLKQDQGGLRQRKGGASEEKSATAQAAQQVRQGTEGVPVQMTAILCLVSFLLAYLFF